ncbi:hypothetical protein OSTOST_04697 [Ostertagia ostertagi]
MLNSCEVAVFRSARFKDAILSRNGCERRGVDWKNTPVLLTGELFSTGPEFSRYAQQTASPLIIMKHLNAALIVE